MDMNTILSTAVGGVISALISYVFFWLGGRDLAREATRLRELNVLLLRAFEEAGLARVNRDENGHPIGLVIEGAAVMESTHVSDACDAEVIRASHQVSTAAIGELDKVKQRQYQAARDMFGPNATAPKD